MKKKKNRSPFLLTSDKTDASLERRLSHLLALSRLLQKTQEKRSRVTHPNMLPQPPGHVLPQELSLARL